ncbi:MAG: Asp-tRNA(Asn)/Glu-tRNA(Gln) amidotransferase subunit GatA [Alphaproteobacteria bacterium]|nr:Asp-tRNA(Asn)/Glu-tRNA(Gln) amidotransferase subunit GatA [Alphaproteobacteria bacterium]
MTDLTKLTIAQAREALKNKEFTAIELTQAYIKNMEAKRELNAFVCECSEKALEQAKLSQIKIENGTSGDLEGIPLGVKDLFCTKGIETTACSNFLKGFVPPYEATVTSKLLKAGANFIGKLNMDEFAMGGSNETSAFGPVVNPYSKDVKLVAGGSSGGSAAAVSANMCAGATGTDTGGSIRQPSAFCGVTGIKPTYGRCSRYGVIAFASSLDQAGPIAKDVRDCAIMLKNMAGYDAKDATSVKVEVPDFEKFLSGDIRGMKIGLPKEYRVDGLNEEVVAYWDKAAQMLKDRGAEIVEISLPHTKYALATYYIIAPAEASSNLARYDGLRYGNRVDGNSIDEMYINSRTQGFGKEVKRRIMVGTYVLSAGYYDAYFLKAQKVRRLIRDDFVKAFEKCDVILTPTSPVAAFPIGDKKMQEDPIAMWLNDIYTVSVSLAGLPAMSLPIGLNKDGLPLGMQIIGKAFDEQRVFEAASALEKQAGFEGVK